MPSDIGVRRRLLASAHRGRRSGTTENITASWWPWYEPSILTMSSRPVAARATRIALIVASVPEFAKRTCSSWKRRHSSSANSTVSSVGAAKCVPVRAARVDRLDDLRVRVADDHASRSRRACRRTRCRRRPRRARRAPRAGRSGRGRRPGTTSRRRAAWLLDARSYSALRHRRAVEEPAVLGVGDLAGRACVDGVDGAPVGHQCFTITCLSSV